MEFKFKVKEFNPHSGKIETIGEKTIYSANGKDCATWVRQEVKGKKKVEMPNLTAAISISDRDNKGVENCLGSINSNSNNVYKNLTDVFIVSCVSSLNANVSIIPDNFRKVVALFCARKSIERTWINWQDEYLVPDTSHKDYEQWNNDAIVYSLFNSKSNQSALRDVQYKDKTWQIFNHFFFMSAQDMKKLFNDSKYNDAYNDAKQYADTDRFVYELLEKTTLSQDASQNGKKIITLSSDAKDILAEARSMIKDSILGGDRKAFAELNPQYHLQAWDAGWAQHKPMFKKIYKERYEQFVEKYKAFEDRMREGVYKFGFLK